MEFAGGYFCCLIVFGSILFRTSECQPGSGSCEYYCNPTLGTFPTISCISWTDHCNGVKDCWDGVDEEECESLRPETESPIPTTETTPVPTYKPPCDFNEADHYGNCTEVPRVSTGTTGNSFLFAWPDTINGSNFKVSIITVGERTANVNISMPGNPHGWHRKLVVPPGHNVEQFISQAMVSMDTTDLDFVSIKVRSDVPISVTALCEAPSSGTSDNFQVIPTTHLGMENYVPLIYTNLYGSGLEGVATVSALSETTRITVSFEHDVTLGSRSVLRGETISKTLQPFQTFQAKVDVSSEDSITVMRVTSDRSIAVVSGSVCGRVPPNGNQSWTCEYLVEQFPPFNQWGRHFIVPHFMHRRGYALMVIAGRDNTTFNKDGDNFTLQKGEHEFFNTMENVVSSIVSDTPVLVVLFSKSSFRGEEGDASMTLVPPLEQFIRGRGTFQVIEYKGVVPLQHYVAVTAPCKSMENFVMDGERLDTSNATSDGEDIMCVYNAEIKPGRHDIWQESGDDPYMVMSYGSKPRVGYGHLIGFSVRNITCQSYDGMNDASSEYYCNDLQTDVCPANTTSMGSSTLTWPETKIFQTSNSTEVCPLSYSRAGRPIASRRCVLTEDLQAVWQSPVDYGCGESLTIETPENLVNTIVTEQNVEEVAETLKTVTGEIESITTNDVLAVTATLTKVVETGSASIEVTESVVQTMDFVLIDLAEAEAEESPDDKDMGTASAKSDMVLLMEQQIQQTLTEQEEVMIVGKAIQVQAFKVVPVETNEDVAIQPVKQQPSDEHTSVLLPKELFEVEETTVFVSFVMFRDDALFQPPPETLEGRRPPDLVMSVSVSSFEVAALSEPVVLNFPAPNDNRTNSSSVSCVFWDFDLNNGSGDWSGRGCAHRETNNQTVTCACDHLTNFAVLMDYMDVVDGPPDPYNQMLDILTKIGCAVSIIGLCVTLTVFAIFKRLRTSRPRRILVHLCVALLCLYITFLFGVDNAAGSAWACPMVAAFIHYFLLSAVFWMGVEALNIYLMLVRVFNMNVSRFVLKGALFAWGGPLLVVSICVGVATEQYSKESYCFLTQGPVLYAALIAPMALILIHNIIVFILVFRNLMTSNIAGTVHGKKTDMDLLKERLQNALTMTTLMGLTWSFGFLMIGHAKFVFQLLFCLFNSFQGLVVFIIFCWRQEDVRKTLRPHCRRAKRKSKEVVGPHGDYEVTSTATGHHTTRLSAEVRKNVTSTGSSTASTLLLSPQKVKANNNLDDSTFV